MTTRRPLVAAAAVLAATTLALSGCAGGSNASTASGDGDQKFAGRPSRSR
jgi:hypothetical protein